MNEKIEAFGPIETKLETIFERINVEINNKQEGTKEIHVKLNHPISSEIAEQIRHQYVNAGWGEVSIYDLENPEIVLRRDKIQLPGFPDDVQGFHDK